MKTQIIQLRCWLVLLSLAASLQITLGYYDPAAQHWINRDPVGEPGFQAAKALSSVGHQVSFARNAIRRQGLYHFVGNSPLSVVDAFGLSGVPQSAGPWGPPVCLDGPLKIPGQTHQKS
jgi:hypothetical protein